MIKKNVLVCALIIGAVAVSCNRIFAVTPVEMTAPKTDTVKTLSETDLKSGPSSVQQAEQDKIKSKMQASKKSSAVQKRYFRPKKIVVDYNRVSKLIEYNYFDEADNILDAAIARNSKDIKAQALSVISMAKQSELEPAQNRLNLLIKQYPDNSNLHYAQGIIYYQRTTSSNMYYRKNSQKFFSNALIEFKKAIDLDKTNAKAYNAAGVLYLKLNDSKSARTYFKKAIEIDSTYSMAIDNLGTIDFSEGKMCDAEKKFREALKYNTQNTTAMYHLAQIFFNKKDYRTALEYLNNALAINSNSPAIYNLMGKAYFEQGNEAAAIDSYRKSISVKPEFTLSYLDLADVYDRRGDSEFAIEQLKTALSINPNYSDAKLKLADIMLESGKYKPAVSVYSELVGVDGYNDSALKGLASAYYGQAQTLSNKALLGSNRELFKALDCINNAISANGSDLELHLAKLKLSKITNQPKQAQEELNKIIQNESNDLISYVLKGEAYLALNDYQNAIKSFDSAIGKSQSLDEDLYLSEIFMFNKQYGSAEKVLKKILDADAENQVALSDLDFVKKSKKQSMNYLRIAQDYLKARNQNTAQEYLIRSVSVDPNNIQARFLLAQLYEKKKDYANSAVNYRVYLGLEPNCPDYEKIIKKIKSMEDRV